MSARRIRTRIELPLPPKGKGRPRGVVIGGRVRMVTPTATRQFEARLAWLAAQQMPSGVIEGPVRVDVLAVASRPKRLLRRRDPDGLLWRPAKPDGDNVRKAVLDGLRAHWRDDAQVVAGETLSAYAERDGRPRLVVMITEEVGLIEDVVRSLGLLEG